MPYTWTRPGQASETTFTTLSVASEGVAVATAATPDAAVDDPRNDRAGTLLVRLFAYLRNNAENHPVLLEVVPVLSSAVASYRTGQAADPFDGVRAVMQKIKELRAADPSIPDA